MQCSRTQETGLQQIIKASIGLFFVIDVYNGGDQFLFVYLDEGNDPLVCKQCCIIPLPLGYIVKIKNYLSS
jgi:hypothetical protein